MSEPKVARDAQERGEGICRTCLAPIWNEGGTIGRRVIGAGWSDRNERGGDSLVCFSAVGYRHVPLTGREAEIYDVAMARANTHGRREFTAAYTARSGAVMSISPETPVLEHAKNVVNLFHRNDPEGPDYFVATRILPPWNPVEQEGATDA